MKNLGILSPWHKVHDCDGLLIRSFYMQPIDLNDDIATIIVKKKYVYWWVSFVDTNNPKFAAKGRELSIEEANEEAKVACDKALIEQGWKLLNDEKFAIMF